MYQVTHKNIDGSLLNLFTLHQYLPPEVTILNSLSTVVLLATELIYFPLDLTINGTIYHPTLLMLTLLTLLKIY